MKEPSDRPPWHTLDISDVGRALQTDLEQGLQAAEAEGRLLRDGRNELPPPSPLPWSTALLRQFADLMIVVLLAAAALAAATGEGKDAAAILAIVLLNSAISAAQEVRADRATAALRSLLPATARVRRAGQVRALPTAEICEGDLVLLDAGAVVPADLRMVEAHDLATQEAALTGESTPVDKHVRALPQPDLPVADRTNLAFKGTHVVRGRGAGLAVATGPRTELGRIAQMMREATDTRTPLQARLSAFGKRISLAVLLLCALLFVRGLLAGEPALEQLLLAVSLAVAAIPEALPAVVTIALALGARRMAARHALVRRLPAVETLGSVTCICTDKTGTLTQNRMAASAYCVDGAVAATLPPTPRGELLRLLLAISNDVDEEEDELRGDPTETALVAAARTHGLMRRDALQSWPRVHEEPFSSVTQRMLTVHAGARGDRWLAGLKGAPEAVIERCPQDPQAAALRTQAEAFAAQGQRVLAFAAREGLGAPPGIVEARQGMQLLGLVALQDPPRPEARAAIAACRSAGIRPVMVTGDHPATALSIARQTGLLSAAGRVVQGSDIDAMQDQELAAVLRQETAFARVSPAHKIRIIRALQEGGEFVAMTGDGVNDAPALRQADIGVAMGKIGTDVARQAADMTLLDDNFATLEAAIEEGRRMYDNVRRFVRFVLAGNAAELLTILAAPLLSLPLPLLPIHILWVNLVTDGLPGLALAAEPSEPDVMRRPPRPPGESLLAGGLWQHAVLFGAFMAALALLSLQWLHDESPAQFRTMVFTTIVLCQLLHAMAIRSERQSLFAIGLCSNLPMLLVVLGSIALQAAIVFTETGNAWFQTAPLPPQAVAAAVLAAVVVMLGVEAEKVLRRRLLRHGAPSRRIAARTRGL